MELGPDVLDEPACGGCQSLVLEPYIQCETCSKAAGKTFVCLHCFAKGVEFDGHHSDHPYSLVKNNFPVFERNWTALEELQLLKAVSDCGYGNWSDIAHKVRTKNPVECERHYNHSYIENPKEDMPGFSEAELNLFPKPVIYKLCEDPPRPGEGSLLATEMAGYMAGRGDFMVEHENYMEMDLRGLQFDQPDEEDALETELKLTVVDVYMRCLKERQRRKRIVRRHGLINLRKNARFRARCDMQMCHCLDSLRVFTQLVAPGDLDIYLEALQYEHELKQEISKLQEYRRNRLTKLRHIPVYKALSKSRDRQREGHHLLDDVLTHVKDEAACQTWLQRQATFDSLNKGVATNLPNPVRKTAPPLEIVELPGFDQLTSQEKELCSHLRLVPAAYLDFKATLVSEASKNGTLRLAQARQLIKIDVNKTRKIFDFLVTEDYIKKE
ncbi:transcriptional adapter 2-alpha-like [Mya arenaria]|uniref:transcriptional adapter 2-alpha-like n=1 Tax=Mya arenaria TaxID=6604 RepID=UPI0022E61D55|nr:transcriptional adapter 2-alpha-like [Mya arenaria]XP_052800809.1 transcriptional adapter 2-alpha-like [Mya arenaria]